MNLIIAILLVVCALVVADVQKTEVVETVQGKVRGVKLKTQLGVSYYSFRGIPYAKPPVGPLRFQPPEPAEPWKGIRDAIEIAPIAPQIGIFTNNSFAGVEDCLYLNVFTPQLPNGQTSLRPVLVYIHGGGFVFGSGNNEMLGPGRMMNTGEVVLVTMNYRLGVLGFLSTGDSVLPGNNGLKDQVLSLKWVQQNIAKFGGDPKKVTLAGESSGASSAHLHMVSPMSKGLFHKAIAQSGSALPYWSAEDSERGRSQAFRLGATLGIKTNNSKELVAALMNISAQELTEASFKPFTEDERHLYGVLCLPVVEKGGLPDNTFMPERPLALIRKGMYNSVPLIMGVTSGEGLLVLEDFFEDPSWYDSLSDDFEPFANFLLQMKKGTPEARETSETIKQHYFGNNRISNETLESLVNMFGDILFNIWADRAVKEHVKASSDPVYYYQFSFRGELGFRLGMDIFNKTSHGADLGYLFEMIFPEVQYLDPESPTMKMCERMLRMWINFAKTGNPTPVQDPLLGVKWKPFTANESNYLNIDDPLTLKTDLNKRAVDFWKTIISK